MKPHTDRPECGRSHSDSGVLKLGHVVLIALAQGQRGRPLNRRLICRTEYISNPKLCQVMKTCECLEILVEQMDCVGEPLPPVSGWM